MRNGRGAMRVHPGLNTAVVRGMKKAPLGGALGGRLRLGGLAGVGFFFVEGFDVGEFVFFLGAGTAQDAGDAVDEEAGHETDREKHIN